MGRGRQKAKHTKVARDLKYFSPDTNYGALEKELGSSTGDPRRDEDLAAWPEYVAGSYNPESFDDAAADDEDEDDDEDVAQNRSA